MADQGGGHSSVIREYRKGNWTVTETMVLIEAKKMDDERRMMKRSSSESEGRNKPTELRWKWVEDYCWGKGCLRSQNQCNDKWDNLMRDYKKVRDYEGKLAEEEGLFSYWKLEKNERKGKNLPSNMLLQIYEALVEVVERRGGGGGGGSPASAQRIMVSSTSASGSTNPIMSYVVERPIITTSLTPIMQHHHRQVSCAIPEALPLPPPPLQPPAPPPQWTQPTPSLPYSHPPLPTEMSGDSSDSDTSEYSDSPAKRRRRSSSGGNGIGIGGGGEGTSTGTASASTSNEVGTAISKSASIIAEALHAREEREERRHRDLLSLHERRLKIEESKTEINRQGMNGLVDAINNLASSILALAANKNRSSK